MARPKYDIVLEAVHYTPDGKIDWVRGYERRGAAFSDRMIWKRDRLADLLRQGKKVVTGQRKEFWGSSFEVDRPVILNADAITTDPQKQQDYLDLPRV